MAAEEEVLGKAYDSRLMKRLLGYLRPFWWQTLVALIAIILKAGMDVVGPYLTKVAVDKYLVKDSRPNILDPWLAPNSDAWTGIAQISLLYVAALALSFLFEFTQTYLMQWVGQKAMFDMRTQIFAHLQHLHIG